MDPRPPKPPAAPPSATDPVGQAAADTNVRPAAARPHPLPFLSPPLQPGEVGRLGSYRVLAQLGRGGMGVVFMAEETDLKRRVALKVMLPEVAADAKAVARFRREAEAQAKVEHDHIVAIYRVGEVNGVPFIAMPLLRGQTLSSALRLNRRPPPAELVRIGREMAEGLAAAHAAGLIHRDVKPGNVWLEGAKRRVKILDFGLARGLAADPDESGTFGSVPAVLGTHLTAAGAVLGTPAYMSPEQALSRPVDHRCDLFSLGVVLYQMTTGRLPFVGAGAFDVLAAVVTEEPPAVGELAPDVPPALAELIGRLLAKDPAGRPPTAEAVAAELEEIARGLVAPPVRVIPLGDAPGGPNPWHTISETEAILDVSQSRVRPAEARGRKPLAIAAGGVVAAAAIVLVAVLSLGPKSRPDPKPETEPVAAVPRPVSQPVPPAPKPKDPVVPVVAAVPSPEFFNGKDLTGWVENTGHWRVEAGELVGTAKPGGESGFLHSAALYRDFELTFEVRVRGKPEGITELSFRSGSRVKADKPGPVGGRRVIFGGDEWGTLAGGTVDTRYQPRPEALRAVRPDEYNAVTVRCIDQRMTVTVNGVVAVVRETAGMRSSGPFCWSLHAGVEEVRVRNVRFTDLTDPKK